MFTGSLPKTREKASGEMTETKTLQPHQERVVTEKKELDEKLSKLKSFFDSKTFATLDPAECDRLRSQAAVMEEYSSILGARIESF